jgi:hypothetical protein
MTPNTKFLTVPRSDPSAKAFLGSRAAAERICADFVDAYNFVRRFKTAEAP